MKTKNLRFAIIFTSLILMSGMAWAQTSSGTLGVSGDLASSINLTFVTDTSGLALTGSGTNTATLNFGTISRYSTPATHVTQTSDSTSFTVSTPFDVSVTKSNVTSANYALSAQLQTVDATNAWTIDTFPLPTAPTAPASLTVTGVYASNVSHTLFLNVPFSEGAATISNTINFLATAN